MSERDASRRFAAEELHRELGRTRARLEVLERVTPQAISFHDGTRVRVRIGLQDDGTYGIRIWDSAGALAFDYTTT